MAIPIVARTRGDVVSRIDEILAEARVGMERLVLEWRLDPECGYAIPDAPARDDLVIVVCNEGYYSSLAARDLRHLGFHRATDLIGGFRAYAEAGLPTVPAVDQPVHGSFMTGEGCAETPQ